MPTPPTLVAFAQTTSAVNTDVAVTTASISWQTDDVVVVFTGCEGGAGGETLNTPTTTGSGISFGAAQRIHNSTGTTASGGCWAAVATANSSGTFSGTYSHVGGTGRFTVIGVYVFRGSAGIGNSAITATPSGTRVQALTPTGADGSICWYVGDWAAAATVAFTPTPTTHTAGSPGPTASPYSQQTANVTYYIGELDDQTSTGSVDYGIGGSGTGPFTIIAIEAKAAAGGTNAPAELAPGTGTAYNATADTGAISPPNLFVVQSNLRLG
jgi:hypothetical protein